MLGGLLASALGVVLGVEVNAALRSRAEIESEFAAVDMPRLLIEVVRLTQDHRELAAAVLGGNGLAEGARSERQGELDQAMAQFGQWLRPTGADALTQADWAEIGTRWHALAQAVQQRRLSVAASGREHGELVQAELDVHDRLLTLPAVRSGAHPAASPAIGTPVPASDHRSERTPDATEVHRSDPAVLLLRRTPALLFALHSWQATTAEQAPARAAALAAWRGAVSPVLTPEAPPALLRTRAVADAALLALLAPTASSARLDEGGARVTEQQVAAARGAVVSFVQGVTAWRLSVLERERAAARSRLHTAAAACAALTTLGWVLLCAAGRLHRHRSPSRAAEIEHRAQTRTATPSVLGERLLQDLRQARLDPNRVRPDPLQSTQPRLQSAQPSNPTQADGPDRSVEEQGQGGER